MQLIEIGQDRIANAASMNNFSVQGPSTATRNDAMAIWYDPSQVNDTTARFKLGSWWFDEGAGNTYQYVKNISTALIGQLVTQAAPATDTVATTGTNKDYITLTTGGLTHNAEVGNYLFILGAAAGGTSSAASLYVQALRKIVANNSDTDSPAKAVYVALTDPSSGRLSGDVLHAAPTGATNVCIIRPYNMDISTATTVPAGVVIGSVAAGSYTMIQKSGLALVQAIGNGTALVVNQGAVPGAAGTILGGTPGQYNAGGAIIPLLAWAGAANTLIPCNVNFIGA